MAEVIRKHITGKADNLLIAPCGAGSDLNYLGDLARQVYGIDLSPIAIERCPTLMQAKVADVLDSGYPDEMFDLVASPLFFHHLVGIGFDPFLKEFSRLLKRGGYLAILEPSVWYPLNIITRPMKKLFGNPYDEVEDEGPFRPKLMLDALRRAGFIDVKMQAASFSHCSFYLPIAKTVNILTKPLLKTWPFKNLVWMIVYFARKPN